MYNINPNIEEAATLPAEFYRNPNAFVTVADKVLAQTWHYIADKSVVDTPQKMYPFTLLEGVLDEPLVLTQDKKEQIHCLSNVCTHRGKIIVEKAGTGRVLSCGYHGRCFRLDGSFKSMPEFEQVKNFPTKADDLPSIDLADWFNLLFVSLDPKVSFEEMIKPIQDRIGWMPLDTMVAEEAASKDYYIDANWALYCDNYLEGFHIPYVHPALNAALSFKDYGYEIFPYCNLQLGIAKEGERCFDIPEGAEDAGKKVLAYYFWMFPNLMFNFYPWGLSLNVVQPLSYNKTKVSFRTYRFKDEPLEEAVAILEDTEMEDEAVVESVQKGVQSRLYHQGRFSPTMEPAVHHFHLLLSRFLQED